jgi:hypothetical protein
MRALALVLLLTATSALANEPQERPDFTRDGLRRAFGARAIDLPDRPGPRVKFPFGGVEFRALGADWRILYLPILLPLPGSAPGVTKSYPDPFVLTQTAVASTPRTWRTVRTRNAELRRIARTERRKSRLSAQTQ